MAAAVVLVLVLGQRGGLRAWIPRTSFSLFQYGLNFLSGSYPWPEAAFEDRVVRLKRAAKLLAIQVPPAIAQFSVFDFELDCSSMPAASGVWDWLPKFTPRRSF